MSAREAQTGKMLDILQRHFPHTRRATLHRIVQEQYEGLVAIEVSTGQVCDNCGERLAPPLTIEGKAA